MEVTFSFSISRNESLGNLFKIEGVVASLWACRSTMRTVRGAYFETAGIMRHLIKATLLYYKNDFQSSVSTLYLPSQNVGGGGVTAPLTPPPPPSYPSACYLSVRVCVCMPVCV